MGNTRLRSAALVVAAVLAGGGAGAAGFDLGGSRVQVMGYLNQGVAYGIAGDHYDTKKGFQSAIFNALLEADYRPAPDLTFYGAGMLTGDWAYELLSGNDEWNDKQFDRSRGELYLDTQLRDLIQELHVTWAPGNFLFRVGKQIVVWGETDGFRLMDQINPLDQRRGLSDVEFETTVLPLWLVRAERYWQPESSWLQDVGLELVFNPNADFDPNRPIDLGNDVAGIWAPNVEVPLPPPPYGPGGTARLGSLSRDIDEPDPWDPSGYEVGVRLRTIINDTIITLNYFNGRDNDPVYKVAGPPSVEMASDGVPILHLPVKGFYPRFRIAGATLTRDLPWLNASFLGGVGPVLRLEAFYGFNNTFMSGDMSRYARRDEVRYAVGADWKVKIPFLNPRAYFMISPQFYHRKILNYPSEYGLNGLEDDNYMTSLFINTSYFHNKLVPSFFWLRDITNNANMFRYEIVYERNDRWNYTLGALLLGGGETGKGFEPLDNKDQVYFTVSYRF